MTSFSCPKLTDWIWETQ